MTALTSSSQTNAEQAILAGGFTMFEIENGMESIGELIAEETYELLPSGD